MGQSSQKPVDRKREYYIKYCVFGGSTASASSKSILKLSSNVYQYSGSTYFSRTICIEETNAIISVQFELYGVDTPSRLRQFFDSSFIILIVCDLQAGLDLNELENFITSLEYYTNHEAVWKPKVFAIYTSASAHNKTLISPETHSLISKTAQKIWEIPEVLEQMTEIDLTVKYKVQDIIDTMAEHTLEDFEFKFLKDLRWNRRKHVIILRELYIKKRAFPLKKIEFHFFEHLFLLPKELFVVIMRLYFIVKEAI